MYSELECGICYRIYNAGRRCPRELRCKHSFCESCLLALSRTPLRGEAVDEAHLGADRSIVCPLCRHTTSIPGDRRIRVELRVDEDVLERLLAVGVLDREDEDDREEEEEEEEEGRVLKDDNEEGTLSGTTAEESDSSPCSRGSRQRWSWKKVWRTIGGRSSQQNCMTNDDMRNLAMMSSYMF